MKSKTVFSLAITCGALSLLLAIILPSHPSEWGLTGKLLLAAEALALVAMFVFLAVALIQAIRKR